jgi:hypothetical protein
MAAKLWRWSHLHMLSLHNKIRRRTRDERSGLVAQPRLDQSLFPAVSHSNPSAAVSGARRAGEVEANVTNVEREQRIEGFVRWSPSLPE